MRYTVYCLLLAIFTVTGCGNGGYQFQKNSLDKIIRDHAELPDFYVILNDMDYRESDETFLHQHTLLYPPASNPDTLVRKELPWTPVSQEEFLAHENDMGMAIATKRNGILEKKTTPPGYDHYVGNEKYGEWKTNSDGGSFWSFYGKYMFFSSMFNMAFRPRYGHWNDYHSNYRPYGRAYYGDHGNGRQFGTSAKSNSGKTWTKKPASFKQRVRTRVRQSPSRRSRISRTSGRNRSGSMRSRGGGFGK